MIKIKNKNFGYQAMILALVAGMVTQGCQAFSYEQAYKKTPVDTVELKTLPPSKTLVTEGEGRYFDRANNLFMRLFNYIKENEVAMTVPVEARMETAQMIFYIGEGDAQKELKNQGPVQVVQTPGRKVVSLGVRGSYTEENFAEASKKLGAWLIRQDRYESMGEPYAVFWNGPFVPGFMKRFEVHIPVKRMDRNSGGESLVAKR